MTFHTAVAVLDSLTGRCLSGVDITRVLFRPLSHGQISRYLEMEKPYDCAGSFRVEGLGIALFQQVETLDPTALVGLPLIRLTSLLDEMGATLL